MIKLQDFDKMAIIAVAGATGRVGKTIIDVLLEQGKHTVVPLARKVSNHR